LVDEKYCEVISGGELKKTFLDNSALGFLENIHLKTMVLVIGKYFR
jgi:hypothetical protein